MLGNGLGKIGLCAFIASAGLLSAGCAQKNSAEHPPVATHINTTAQTPPSPALSSHGTQGALSAEITFTKRAILDRDFLYGSDLQYSSIGDEDLSLLQQSIALGHVPVRFRIRGQNLQLVADQTHLFESNINHPERLVHEFPILRHDAESVTVRIERASPVLNTVISGKTAGPVRTSWVRSVEYVREGDYLLIESSVEDAQGFQAEFMESVFPRDTLVPAGYKPLLNDPEREGLAARFRFLSDVDVWTNLAGEGRVKTKIASRFNVKAGETIDWYVTPNVPDAYLNDIRTGVEGWNRYSQAMWGKDFIRFAGKLPAHVKIGDPRYNVINWDSVAEAGAAYESQASDPLTGIQSHSLIYLPYAWVNIGRDYWNSGKFSEKAENSRARLLKSLSERSFMGRPLSVSCARDITTHLSLQSRQDPETFARELLKGVLMHEIGHALGLAHNFKGSLSWDSEDASTPSTTSIMDYNQYHIEREAYESVDSDKGPLLSYDHQILMALYNNGEGLDKLPEIPACNDEETDKLEGGVDPLCIRYDSGKDPTVNLKRSFELLTNSNARLGSMHSLPKAIAQVLGSLKEPSEVTSLELLNAHVNSLAAALKGSVGFYVAAGAQSLNYMARANIRSLQTFQDKVLPENYVEKDLRVRALEGLEAVANLDQLPEASHNALQGAIAHIKTWITSTTAIQTLPVDKRAEALAAAYKPLDKINDDLAGRDGLLSRMRARVLGAVVRAPAAPFEFLPLPSFTVDLETRMAGLLEARLLAPIGGKARSFLERQAIATALKSFAGTDVGDNTIERTQLKLRQEISNSRDAKAREEARKLLKLLDKSTSSAASPLVALEA